MHTYVWFLGGLQLLEKVADLLSFRSDSTALRRLGHWTAVMARDQSVFCSLSRWLARCRSFNLVSLTDLIYEYISSLAG
jgi:hypothetical protein